MVADTEGRPADLAWGAFSDAPPWVLDPDAIAWRADVPRLRTKVAADLPGLTAPGRLPPSARFIRVNRRLTRALVPWLARKRLGRYASDTPGADLSKRLAPGGRGLAHLHQAGPDHLVSEGSSPRS